MKKRIYLLVICLALGGCMTLAETQDDFEDAFDKVDRALNDLDSRINDLHYRVSNLE